MTRPDQTEDVEYTITYLEMSKRPGFDRPSVPPGLPTALIAAGSPPAWYFLDLYRAVGQGYEWVDMLDVPEQDLAANLAHPEVTLYTLMRDGWPAGFFILDGKQTGICDLAYFGLVPEAIGQGLGTYLLHTAIHAGWDRNPERLTVNTCTLDHPRALGLYQKAGFVPVRQETRTRVMYLPRSTTGA